MASDDDRTVLWQRMNPLVLKIHVQRGDTLAHTIECIPSEHGTCSWLVQNGSFAIEPGDVLWPVETMRHRVNLDELKAVAERAEDKPNATIESIDLGDPAHRGTLKWPEDHQKIPQQGVDSIAIAPNGQLTVEGWYDRYAAWQASSQLTVEQLRRLRGQIHRALTAYSESLLEHVTGAEQVTTCAEGTCPACGAKGRPLKHAESCPIGRAARREAGLLRSEPDPPPQSDG